MNCYYIVYEQVMYSIDDNVTRTPIVWTKHSNVIEVPPIIWLRDAALFAKERKINLKVRILYSEPITKIIHDDIKKNFIDELIT